MGARIGLASDAVTLAALKLAVSLWVLTHGFTHVSDDDYARTVIAQQFAHAPRLDPSGTSWLPLPFWLTGTVMAAAGRSLLVARGLGVALSSASVVAPYAAFRVAGMRRAIAFGATAVGLALPWNAWLGAAFVPESWVGALVGAALVAMANDRARPWCAGALLAASLSRYEAWPACALLAVVCLVRARQGQPIRRELACGALALAGVAGWMIWNAHTHGSPVHFLARVSAFRRAVGGADVPLADKLLGYPLSLARETPEAALLGATGVAGVIASTSLRARWRWALAGVGVILAFLVYGDVRDGAPTHHAARALAPIWWVFVGAGFDALVAGYESVAASLPAGVSRACAGAACLAGVTWLGLLPGRWIDAPGRSDAERREIQISRGEDIARRDVAHVEITPCAFEHFALLAAWGKPERATVHGRAGTPPTEACPLLVER